MLRSTVAKACAPPWLPDSDLTACATSYPRRKARNLRAFNPLSQRLTAPGEKTPDGTVLTFLPAQFTKDFEVRVDAHSSSPIFIEDRKNDAVTMLENKVITRDKFLDMMDPPGLQELKADLREKIEPEERAAAAAQQQSEQQGGKK